MRSRSGSGENKCKDPVLDLMMNDLMQWESTSNSGANFSNS
jgi:hypothetical protein